MFGNYGVASSVSAMMPKNLKENDKKIDKSTIMSAKENQGFPDSKMTLTSRDLTLEGVPTLEHPLLSLDDVEEGKDCSCLTSSEHFQHPKESASEIGSVVSSDSSAAQPTDSDEHSITGELNKADDSKNSSTEQSQTCSEITLDMSLNCSLSKSSDQQYKYDFVVLWNENDNEEVDRIYAFLEDELKLKGYKHNRDNTLGKYELPQRHEASRDANKILLFITPRSKDCAMVNEQINLSMYLSIENNIKNVVPVYWQITREEIPITVKHICSIDYQNCNEKFKVKISKIFGLEYSSSVEKLPGTSATNTHSISSSFSASSKLRQSQSLPTPKRKKSFFRWFSS